MNEEVLDIAMKKISDLEKRIEKYYKLLKIDNELDFILKGGYILEEDIQLIMEGNYE